MNDELKNQYDEWTPRQQRFFDSSGGFKDGTSEKLFYSTSDRSLAVFLIYQNHKVKHIMVDNHVCYIFALTKRLKVSITEASIESGVDLFHIIDRSIGIFVNLLVTEAMTAFPDDTPQHGNLSA